MPVVGDTFPPFTLVDQDGTAVSSADLAGAWFLLCWLPTTDGPKSTVQAQGLGDQIEAFDELRCAVLGVSFEEPIDSKAFVLRCGLPFRLLSDLDEQLSASLGVINDVSAGGYPRRISYLVDPSGAIAKRYDVDDPAFFAEHVLDDLEELLDA